MQMSASRTQRRESQDLQRAQKAAAAMTAKAAELVLVRHGETAWNREHRLQGQQQPGPPLNQLGWKQCELLRGVLQQRFAHFDAVVSSDLLRTVQTAQVLAGAYNLQVQQHPGLRERNLGVLQGLTYAEAPQAQPDAWAALQSSSSSARIPGGGESLDDLQLRMAGALLDIAAQYPGKRVLLVSHGGALHAAHRAARGYAARGKVFNCGISIMMAELHSSCPSRSSSLPGQQQPPQQHSCEQLEQQAQCRAQGASAESGGQHNSRSNCSSSLDGQSCKQHGSSIHLEADCRGAAAQQTCIDKSHCSSDDCGANPVKQQEASGGRMALLVWNDGHELVAHGMLDASSFGGSAKEA